MHTDSMQDMHTHTLTKRITISLPKHLYDSLHQKVENESVSAFVATAIEDRLVKNSQAKLTPAQAFEEMCKIGDSHPMTREKIRAAIDEGRA